MRGVVVFLAPPRAGLLALLFAPPSWFFWPPRMVFAARAQALADALGLLRRVAGFSRRFGGLLLFFRLLRIELAADQLDLRDFGGVAAAVSELEDAGVAARAAP